MIYFTLDRWEENFAVLENRNTKEMTNVKRSLLPKNAKEGDILLLQDGKYVIDTLETERVKQEVAKLMRQLKKN